MNKAILKDYRMSYGLIRNEEKTGNVGGWVMYTHIETGERHFGIGYSQVKAKEMALQSLQPIETTSNKDVDGALNQVLETMQEFAVLKKYSFIKDHNDMLKIGHSDFKAYKTLKQALSHKEAPKLSSEVEELFEIVKDWTYQDYSNERYVTNYTVGDRLKRKEALTELKTTFQQMQQREDTTKQLLDKIGDITYTPLDEEANFNEFKRIDNILKQLKEVK